MFIIFLVIQHYKQALQIIHDLCRVSNVHAEWKREMITMLDNLDQMGHQEACALKIFKFIMKKNGEIADAEADKILRALDISPEIFTSALILPPPAWAVASEISFSNEYNFSFSF